ncbi:MAG: hypothetical protein QOH55_1432 [Microbacteriaceae bacterium]|nr:hypothetical protein [Microbacteriaceae bacterium]
MPVNEKPVNEKPINEKPVNEKPAAPAGTAGQTNSPLTRQRLASDSSVTRQCRPAATRVSTGNDTPPRPVTLSYPVAVFSEVS